MGLCLCDFGRPFVLAPTVRRTSADHFNESRAPPDVVTGEAPIESKSGGGAGTNYLSEPDRKKRKTSQKPKIEPSSKVHREANGVAYSPITDVEKHCAENFRQEHALVTLDCSAHGNREPCTNATRACRTSTEEIRVV